MTTTFDAWCFLFAAFAFALAIFSARAQINLLAIGLFLFALPFVVTALAHQLR